MTKNMFLKKLAQLRNETEDLMLAMYEDSTPLMEEDDMITLENDLTAIKSEIDHTAQWLEITM